MDTLLSLQVFAEVAEHKSFSFVANRLGISPAMTSKHVQHLEARVGARLLNRNSRNVSLTEAGSLYLSTVRSLLEGLEDAETQLASNAAPHGTLRVSMPVWMANASFARILSSYHEEHPAVVLDLDLRGRKINLVEEVVDLALRVTPSLDNGLIARQLVDVEFLLVAAPSFLNRHGRPETVADLTDAPFLIYSGVITGQHIRFGSGEDAIDIRFAKVLQSENENLLHLAACEGMGFAFLPHFLAEDDLESGVLELVLRDIVYPKLPLHAIYPDRSYLPKKVRSFIDFLVGPKGLQAQSIALPK